MGSLNLSPAGQRAAPKPLCRARRTWIDFVPYWLCKLCEEKLPTWSSAREHIYTVHNEEVMRLLGDSMIPEMMLLQKHLE